MHCAFRSGQHGSRGPMGGWMGACVWGRLAGLLACLLAYRRRRTRLRASCPGETMRRRGGPFGGDFALFLIRLET